MNRGLQSLETSEHVTVVFFEYMCVLLPRSMLSLIITKSIEARNVRQKVG